MKIFDKDGDGDFDLKDVLIMSTLFGTFLNLVFNVFSVLNIGVNFTLQDSAVLNCGVVKVEGRNEVRCFKPGSNTPIPTTPIPPPD